MYQLLGPAVALSPSPFSHFRVTCSAPSAMLSANEIVDTRVLRKVASRCCKDHTVQGISTLVNTGYDRHSAAAG